MALISAAASGNIPLIIHLVKSGKPPIDGQDPSGKTALIWAVVNNRVACIKILMDALIAAKADPNAKDHEGKAALHWAIATSHLDCLEELLKYPSVDIEARDSMGRTPLTRATCLGCVKSMDILLAAGADKDTQDQFGRTPVFVATRRLARGDPKPEASIDRLLKEGANIDQQDTLQRTVATWCAQTNNTDVLKKVLSTATKHGIRPDLTITDSHCGCGCSCRCGKRTALDWAVYNKNCGTTRELSMAGSKKYNPYGTQKYDEFVTYSKAELSRAEAESDLPKFNQMLPLVKRKLKTCSYRKSGDLDFSALFRIYNRDGGRTLNLDSFKSALRKSLQISPKEMPDSDIRILFTMMDQDGTGEVHVDRILDTFGLSKKEDTTMAKRGGGRGVASEHMTLGAGGLPHVDTDTMTNFTTQGTISSIRWGTTSRTTSSRSGRALMNR